jgi:integrase
LVAAFKGHSIYPIVATAAFTGARKGEMLALRWIDVNLDARTISTTRKVEEVKVRGGDGTRRKPIRRVKGPKTKRGIRTIQIDSGLCGLLRLERGEAPATGGGACLMMRSRTCRSFDCQRARSASQPWERT